jgi:ABC-type nickel/cobalt efflux system permease component RcnA
VPIEIDWTQNNLVLLLLMIPWGVLHGLTPHGHSWLVMLPFVLGGLDFRGIMRLSTAYCLGMLLTAVVTGALLGLVTSAIPEAWSHGVEVATSGLLILVGLIFMFRPLSIHHAIDHICNEHCHSGEERKLLRSGTAWAMFTMGAMSMLFPCPENVPIYTLPAASRSPVMGMSLFFVYGLSTGATFLFVAGAMVRARGLVEFFERRDARQLMLRLSGLIVLGTGLWLGWSLLGH